MKRYRVWEANRKIFLWPENWLEPEFRDDKTHLFQALESNLLQGDVSTTWPRTRCSATCERWRRWPGWTSWQSTVEEKADPDAERPARHRAHLQRAAPVLLPPLRVRHVDAVGAGDHRDRRRPPGRGRVAGAPAPVLGDVPGAGDRDADTDASITDEVDSTCRPSAAQGDRRLTCTGRSTTRANGPPDQSSSPVGTPITATLVASVLVACRRARHGALDGDALLVHVNVVVLLVSEPRGAGQSQFPDRGQEQRAGAGCRGSAAGPAVPTPLTQGMADVGLGPLTVDYVDRTTSASSTRATSARGGPMRVASTRCGWSQAARLQDEPGQRGAVSPFFYQDDKHTFLVEPAPTLTKLPIRGPRRPWPAADPG